MVTYVYNLTSPTGDSSYLLWVDKAMTIPAVLFDVNGTPLNSNQLTLNPDGSWPTFQSPSAPLFLLDNDGTRVQASPGANYASPQAVTGSKATATATVLGNLITALVNAGIPIVDQTT